MDEQKKWDGKMVATRMEEAAETMKRLPNERMQGYRSSWPETLPSLEDYRESRTKVRLGPPSPDAIDRMDETMSWLRWLERDQIRLVWSRAVRIPWKLILRQLGVCRETARLKYLVALISIASRLNHMNGEKMPRHLSSGHSSQDLL